MIKAIFDLYFIMFKLVHRLNFIQGFIRKSHWNTAKAKGFSCRRIPLWAKERYALKSSTSPKFCFCRLFVGSAVKEYY